MPHFSKGTHTFEQIETNKHYRLAGWVNMPTKWNDTLKQYEPRTQEQIDAQRQIYELMKKHGAGIQVSVQERMHGLEPKDFPVKQRFNMFVNNYENYQSASAPAAPPSPAGPIIDDNDDMGWD
jgi:hypothetical protein